MRRENIIMVDSEGVIYAGREQGMNPYKARFARPDDGARTLADAMRGADVFVGLSGAGACTADDAARRWPSGPIVFALANPDPEIGYDEAQGRASRRDRRHRPQRLPEPGQQRPRLPVHLPRRARRARHARSTRR